MNKPTLQQLTSALHQAWDATTGYAEEDTWDGNNPARAQCVTSSLVVQDYFGGDIARYRVSGDAIDETHTFNILEDGTILDTTGMQYKGAVVSMKLDPLNLGEYSSAREKRLADDDTQVKYNRLKSKVESILGI